MRAIRRRSPAWLATAALLFVAACTPPRILDGRPAPCADTYTVCPTTGKCYHPEELSDPEEQAHHRLCPLGYTVRQGAAITIDVPERSLGTVVITGPSDLVVSPKVADEGDGVVEISAPHGSLLGQNTPAGVERVITIETGVGRTRSIRRVPIFVSPIAAAPAGSDDDLGTEDHPFRTFARAAGVARGGDTIVLRNAQNGASEPEGTPKVVLPAGVIVHGRDGSTATGGGTTLLLMPLELEGNVTLDNLRLGKRLVVTVPRTHVVLHDVVAVAGVSVDREAAGTDLSISGGWTEIRSDDRAENPLLVESPDTTVTIGGRAKVTLTGSTSAEAVRITGQSPTVTVLDANIWGDVGTTAMRVDRKGVVVVIGSELKGRLEIRGADSASQIWDSTFRLAGSLGGIVFLGRELMVRHSNFYGEGIEQNAPGSSVVVRESTFHQYMRFGYRLMAGNLNLGTVDEAGNNTFKSTLESWPGMATPSGLMVEAATGEGTVSSSMTTYDGIKPDPCRKEMRGEWPHVYRMTNDGVLIDFY